MERKKREREIKRMSITMIEIPWKAHDDESDLC